MNPVESRSSQTPATRVAADFPASKRARARLAQTGISAAELATRGMNHRGYWHLVRALGNLSDSKVIVEIDGRRAAVLEVNDPLRPSAERVLAELQLGIRVADSSGEQMFEKPFEEWTWELTRTSAETESGEASGLTQIEVIIRRKNPDLVYRLAQLLKLEPAKQSEPLTTASSTANP